MADSSPPAAQSQRDDIVLPFQTELSGISGRIVRLGPAVDAILKRHDYPEAVSRVLGEALSLVALLGTALKFDGKLILQTKTDGPLSMLVAHYETPGQLRGYASFDAARVAALGNTGTAQEQGWLLGSGHLAMTIDPGGDMDRYQGIVGMDGHTLAGTALTYFRQSEQLPTFIRLAVAKQFASGAWRWRAGGILLQHLTSQGGLRTRKTGEAHDEHLFGEDDDDWRRVELLAATAEDHELLDPTLSPERLLYRLFHEEGVRVSGGRAVIERCRCSQERFAELLRRFDTQELADLRDPDGSLAVTCEFCSSKYRFPAGEIE